MKNQTIITKKKGAIKMKRMRKFIALLLAAIMVMAMGLTAAAANVSGTEGTVSIGGIESDNASIALYQVAGAKYTTNNGNFVKYTWAQYVVGDITKTTEEAITNGDEGEILALVNALKDASVEVKLDDEPVKAMEEVTWNKTNGVYVSSTLPVGAYIAIITDNSGCVYNPVVLTVSYNENGALVSGNINDLGSAVYGTAGTAKKSKPSVDKKIDSTTVTTDGTITEVKNDTVGESTATGTVSVGSIVKFEANAILPAYPTNAVNKTVYFSDTMANGLDYLEGSLTVTLNAVSADVSKNEGIYTYTIDGGKIAEARDIENGFDIVFDYDALGGYAPVLTYKAVITENAVVGSEGNANEIKLYYANDPTSGETWDELTDKNQEDSTIIHTEDKEYVYTYQLAFLKTGIDEDGDDVVDALEGAVFGIYSDDNCEDLVDVVVTNTNGYAVSTKVSAGNYYIKELSAPQGYSLNENVYTMEASMTSATTKISETTTERKYTSDSKEAIAGSGQVGWLYNDKFYESDDENALASALGLSDGEKENIKAAYIKTETSSSVENISTETTTAGGGTVTQLKLLDGDNQSSITNTKISSLPSTGGVGTTIFTIGGVILMVGAAGVYFVSRRKKNA